MEREWRVLGQIEFQLRDLSCVYVPEAFKQRATDERDLRGALVKEV
jgi:hypothetical protein